MGRLFSGLPFLSGDAQPQHVFEIGTDPYRSWLDELNGVVAQVTLNAIAASEGELLLHAGAVSGRDGGVAVLCGRSSSGKSTLTAALAGSGLGYLTDETVRLDPYSLHVTPFRRPLSLKPGSHLVLPHLRPEGQELGEGIWLVPPDDLGDAVLPTEPFTPRLLVFPMFDRAAECELEAISPGQAAFLLGEQSSRLRVVRGGALPALARLARRAPAYRLQFGDVERATPVLRALLEAA